MRSVELQENVEIVLAAYARFNSGDRTADDLEIWGKEGEFHSAPEDPESSVHRGINAIRRHYDSWIDTYPDLTLEPVEATGRGTPSSFGCTAAGAGGKVGSRSACDSPT